MEPDILKTAGEVAGIGGVAIGVAMIVFRDIIGKSVFPTLPASKAYRLLNLLTAAVWSIAIVGIGAWVYVNHAPASASSSPNVDAQCGGVAIGGNVSGATIQGGTAADCGAKAK